MKEFRAAVEVLHNFTASAKVHLEPVLMIVGVVWVINFINWYLFRSRLTMFGLYPHSIPHLITGTFVSPVIHGDFTHLLYNTLPFTIMSIMIMSLNYTLYINLSIYLTLATAVLTFLFGRKAIHIGASSIIFGYLGFLIALAFNAPSVTSVFIVIVVFYYFGTMLAGLLPLEEQTSFEGHIFGFFSGIALFFYFTL